MIYILYVDGSIDIVWDYEDFVPSFCFVKACGPFPLCHDAEDY